MAAVVHGAADVAVLAHGMNTVFDALSKKSAGLANGGDYFDEGLHALIKQIDALKKSGKYSKSIVTAAHGSIKVAHLYAFSQRKLVEAQNDPALQADADIARFVDLLIQSKKYMNRDRGFRKIAIIEQWHSEEESRAMSLVVLYELVAGAPIMAPLPVLVDFARSLKEWNQASSLHNMYFDEPFNELKRMISFDAQGNIPEAFFKRAVRCSSDGWFIIMPAYPHEQSADVQKKLGLDLHGWTVINSLEHAESLEPAKNLLKALLPEQSFLPLLPKILDQHFDWVILIAGHGGVNSDTCGMPKIVFEDLLGQLNQLQIRIKKLIVSTCHGGDSKVMKYVYGDLQPSNFDIIIPTLEEGPQSTEELLNNEFLFFVDHPYYPIHLSRHRANSPREMLIRYAGEKQFVSFDPWNSRIGERADAPFYAPAVPWTKGMTPEFVHPAARVR